jgi:hypothetical protein
MMKAPSPPGSTVSIPAHQSGKEFGSCNSIHTSSIGAWAWIDIENSGIFSSLHCPEEVCTLRFDPCLFARRFYQADDRRTTKIDQICEVALRHRNNEPNYRPCSDGTLISYR